VAAVLSSRLLGELLALVAHDLRNPLSALQSNLGYLESIVPSGDLELAGALEDGVASCDGLNHVIGNLDLVGQLLRGAAGAEPRTRVDVLQLVEEVLASSQPTAASHGVALVLDAESVSAEADLRRDLSTRCVANLVRNSIQHAGRSRIVRLQVLRTGTVVSVRVEDDGVAAPDDTDVFSAEGQLSSKSLHHGRYSRGLGLYCARIAGEADGWVLRIGKPTVPGPGNAFLIEHAL
jgi:signal transduction histidine kinase